MNQPTAHCGRDEEHGAHRYLETHGPRNGRASFCAGNRNIVEGQPAGLLDRAAAHALAVDAMAATNARLAYTARRAELLDHAERFGPDRRTVDALQLISRELCELSR